MPASKNDVSRADETGPDSDPDESVLQAAGKRPVRDGAAALDATILGRTGEALAAQAAQAKETSGLIRSVSAAQTSTGQSLISSKARLRAERPRVVVEAAGTVAEPPARVRGARRGASASFALVLEEDPDLARGLPDADRELLTGLFRAPVVTITGRRWQPPAPDGANALGLLLLDGVIGRRTRVGGAVATELLGAGDVLRGGGDPAAGYPMETHIDWRVLRPGRAAILDEGITRLIGGRPELLVAFAERLIRRTHNAAYMMALNHFSRVEDRLLATLWHLASMWGRVTPQGISIPLRLTHETLGEITGARRSTVTIGLGVLQARGQLVRGTDGRYVMTGDPEAWRLPE